MALTAEQVAERTTYIGGSDAAAVLGLSRWKTPYQLWGEKTGVIPAEDISDRLAVEVGNDLEDTVARLWMKRTGKKLHRVNETLTHPQFPFIRCNLDRRVVGEDSDFEAKTASAWKAKEWDGEEIPQEYILQCQHNMAVSRRKKCEIAVLVGGNVDFVFKTIYRDEAAIAKIIEREVEFWTKFVVPKVAPSLKHITKSDADVLFRMFPNGDEGEPAILGDEANALVDSIKAMQQDLKNLEGVIEKEKNILKAMLGDKTFGLTGKYKVSWKNQVTNRLDTDRLKKEQAATYAAYLKETPSRVLRMTEVK